MSTSAYYNFMTATAKVTPSPQKASATSSLEARRRSAMSSPSFANCSPSFSSSTNTSSSSLNQFASLTQTTATVTATAVSVACSNTASSNCSNSSSSSCCNSNSSRNGQLESSPSSSNCSSSFSAKLTSNLSSQRFNKLQHRDLQRKSSITATMRQFSPNDHQHHSTQMFRSYTLHSLEPKPFRPFKTKSDYIEAMKEDLAEWLNQLYPDLDLTTESFFSQLETGAIICRHANNVTLMGRNLLQPDTHHTNLNDPHNSLTNESSYGSISIEPNNNQATNNRHHRASSNSPISSASSNDFSLCSSSTKSTMALMSPRQMSLTSLSRAATDINWFWVKMILYKEQAKAGTFFARDNICQFILWCRSLNILECLLFETDDLVARKNEKSFILCLLEVARIGFKVGMPTPLIIQFEQEIDREIEEEAKLGAEKQKQITETTNSQQLNAESCSDLDDSSSKKTSSDDEHDDEVCAEQAKEEQKQQLDTEKKLETSLDDEQAKQSEEEEDVEEEDYGPKPQVITNDLVSLHEKVVQLLCQCTCPTQFPMVRVGDNGKYKIGDKLIIFVRILRRHIMVRVGGGWQELSEFLRAKDPCRSKR